MVAKLILIVILTPLLKQYRWCLNNMLGVTVRCVSRARASKNQFEANTALRLQHLLPTALKITWLDMTQTQRCHIYKNIWRWYSKFLNNIDVYFTTLFPFIRLWLPLLYMNECTLFNIQFLFQWENVQHQTQNQVTRQELSSLLL